jgi:hypothetical protein
MQLIGKVLAVVAIRVLEVVVALVVSLVGVRRAWASHGEN